MSALLNCEIDPSLEVEGVPGALSMLEDLYNEHRHDIEIVKSVCLLSVAEQSFRLNTFSIGQHLSI